VYKHVLLVAALSVAADLRSSPTAFIISKSENRNQVHYAVRVDDACMPVGATPVEPYWHMLEKSATSTELLLPRERRAYGIAKQEVRGARITLTLTAIADRPIVVTTSRDASGHCTASSVMSINGNSARLFNIHLAMSPFGIDHLVVTGWDGTGRVVRERVSR
jgi:hypothetical protein